jgi:hypothetical protein
MCVDPPPEVIVSHEAGHVIAARALHRHVRSATIPKEDDRYGSRFGAAAYDNSLKRVGPTDHIIILMTGFQSAPPRRRRSCLAALVTRTETISRVISPSSPAPS